MAINQNHHFCKIYRDYDLLDYLGRGGCGVAFSARKKNQKDSKLYVVKRSFPINRYCKNSKVKIDPSDVKRWEEIQREIEVRIEHENVVFQEEGNIELPDHEWVVNCDPMYQKYMEGRSMDTSEWSNILLQNDGDEVRIFPVTTVQEYCEGGSLDLYLKQETLRPLPNILNLACQLANGLKAIHNYGQDGIIHRDIKPGNIFIAKSPQDGSMILKIGDFGLSKVLGRYITPEGKPAPTSDSSTYTMHIGTPRFMAPELEEGSPHSSGVDIYALALTIICLIVKETDQAREIRNVKWLARHGQGNTKPLGERDINLKREVEKVHPNLYNLLLQMLSTDPDLRPTSTEVYEKLLLMKEGYLKFTIKKFFA